MTMAPSAPSQSTGNLPDATAERTPAELFGVIAEFDDVNAVKKATQATCDAGYTKVDVHTPFPIHGIDDILGIKPTILPWFVLIMGLTGCFSGFVLTMYTMSTDFSLGHFVSLEGYQFLISGKPLQSLPAFIPVMFEMTIMFAAYTAVFAMFLLNKLPQHYFPPHKSEKFMRATQDRFFIVIEAKDRQFDDEATPQFLKEQGALSTELIED